MKLIIFLQVTLLIITGCSQQSIEVKKSNVEKVFDSEEASFFSSEYRSPVQTFEFLQEYEFHSGSVVDDQQITNRSVCLLNKGNHFILILEKVNRGPKPTKIALDSIHFQINSPNQYMDLVECEELVYKGRTHVLAIYEYEDVEYFQDIKKAWELDLVVDKILPVDTSGLQCINIGFGS